MRWRFTTSSAARWLADLPVGLLHGAWTSHDKQAGESRLRWRRHRCARANHGGGMGVDVPEASGDGGLSMPRFFGLAQLHPLRGRVGRVLRVSSHCLDQMTCPKFLMARQRPGAVGAPPPTALRSCPRLELCVCAVLVGCLPHVRPVCRIWPWPASRRVTARCLRARPARWQGDPGGPTLELGVHRACPPALRRHRSPGRRPPCLNLTSSSARTRQADPCHVWSRFAIRRQ